MRKHLIPAIGKVKLKDLTAEHLDGLYARKVLDGLSPRTVGYIHSAIRVALQRAVKKRLVPYNVARDAEPPSLAGKAKSGRPSPWLNSGTSSGRAPKIRTVTRSCHAGSPHRHDRASGALGLEWGGLVLPEDPTRTGLVRLRRRLSKSSAGLEILEGSKTGKMRDVELLPEVVAALKAHRKPYLEERMRYTEIWQGAWQKQPAYEDLVFLSLVGTPPTATTSSSATSSRLPPKPVSLKASPSTPCATASLPSGWSPTSPPRSFKRSSATPA